MVPLSRSQRSRLTFAVQHSVAALLKRVSKRCSPQSLHDWLSPLAEPNPYRDAGPWGVVVIGGRRLPGVVLSIDGAERPEEWDVQKPTEKSGAATVWKGTGVAKSIKIIISLTSEAAVDEYRRVNRTLRPKLGAKPPSLPIVNPIINWVEITQVSCRNVAAPKWKGKEGYWTGEITVIDFSPPKPAKTGAAKRGSSGGSFAGSSATGDVHAPNQYAEIEAEIRREQALYEAKERAAS